MKQPSPRTTSWLELLRQLRSPSVTWNEELLGAAADMLESEDERVQGLLTALCEIAERYWPTQSGDIAREALRRDQEKYA